MHGRSLTPLVLSTATLAAGHLWAGSDTAAGQRNFDRQGTAIVTATTVAPAPEYVVLRRPYLKIVGPTGLRFARAEEPIVRRPPSMPAVRKASLVEPKEADAVKPPAPFSISTLPAQPAQPPRSSASLTDLADDNTLLPPPAPAAAPTATPASVPVPDALSLPSDGGNGLSDALQYFDTPTANGTRGVLIAPSILEPPLGQPQPPSSATYQVQ
jgi:hypothetical protein